MKFHSTLFVVVTLLIFSLGCVGQNVDVKEGLSIDLSVDPADIFYTEQATLFADMENLGDKDFTKLDYAVFDTGILECRGCRHGNVANPLCLGQVEDISPDEIVSVECDLGLRPGIPLVEQNSQTTVSFKATSENELKSTFVVQALSHEEWRRRVTTGNLQRIGSSFGARDNNLQMDITFTKDMPFVENQAGEKVLFSVKLSNIGNGYINELKPEQFMIEQQFNYATCDFTRTLTSFNGQFPPIYCELLVTTQGQSSANYPITISVNYQYEVRDSVDVTIRR